MKDAAEKSFDRACIAIGLLTIAVFGGGWLRWMLG